MARLYFYRLPAGISDVEFQKFLHKEAGIYLPLERISVQWYSDGSACKVSVSNHESQQLNWLLEGKALNGKPVSQQVSLTTSSACLPTAK